MPLEQTVRHYLHFLFGEYGATVTSNTIEAPGIFTLTLYAGNVEFKFNNNKRDSDYRILMGPCNADGIWELLYVALAAATGDDARLLNVPVWASSDIPFF